MERPFSLVFACDGQLGCLGQGMLMKEDIYPVVQSDILTWQALIFLILNMFSAPFSQKLQLISILSNAYMKMDGPEE